MDRNEAIPTLAERQKFINEGSASRARAVLQVYVGSRGYSYLTDAVIHLLVDVAHLAHDENAPLRLGEIEAAVRLLFGAERLREAEQHLENTVPAEGFGSFPAVPE